MNLVDETLGFIMWTELLVRATILMRHFGTMMRHFARPALQMPG